jgi:lipopolysaccharide export system protein LptA
MPLFRCLWLLLLVGGLSLAQPARAQLGTPDSSAPINVQADNGIEWQQDKQLYIARGNAVATRGPASIKADTIIAHYREAKGGNTNTGSNNEIYRIEAEGNVVITRDTRTVVGDHADYDMDQGIGIVHGKALKMTTATDVVTAKDALEWYDEKQVAVARGDAVAVRQGGRTIKADTLTAYMVKTAPPPQPGAPGQAAKPGAAPAKPATPPAKPAITTASANGPAANGAPPANAAAANNNSDTSKINRIDAQGHVVVLNGPDIGRGDYGVYNAVTDICTLLGNVTITRGADVITGQYAVMNLANNISRIMPASSLPGSTRQRVQGLFVKQDLAGNAGGPANPSNGANATNAAAPKTATPGTPSSITLGGAAPKGK